MWTGGAEHIAPVFDRTSLRAGDHVAGPALIRAAAVPPATDAAVGVYQPAAFSRLRCYNLSSN
jgi:hypothetical protein